MSFPRTEFYLQNKQEGQRKIQNWERAFEEHRVCPRNTSTPSWSCFFLSVLRYLKIGKSKMDTPHKKLANREVTFHHPGWKETKIWVTVLAVDTHQAMVFNVRQKYA